MSLIYPPPPSCFAVVVQVGMGWAKPVQQKRSSHPFFKSKQSCVKHIDKAEKLSICPKLDFYDMFTFEFAFRSAVQFPIVGAIGIADSAKEGPRVGGGTPRSISSQRRQGYA